MKSNFLKYYLAGLIVGFIYILAVIIYGYNETINIENIVDPTQIFTESDLMGIHLFNEGDTIDVDKSSKLLIIHFLKQKYNAEDEMGVISI